jgi:prepilin-type N-terminal cleavage/methylation domain-containing protein
MPAPDAREAGFSLVEVIVGMAVFTVLATSALALVVRTTDLAASNNRRVVAANLASRQIESVRGTRAVDIPDGLATRTETLGGVAYTVSQTSNYVATNSTASVCSSGGGTLAYKLVTVTVSWPGMGRVSPVRADTLRALGVGSDGLDDTQGTLALSVLDAHGGAESGVTVTLSPGGTGRTTGVDGCAVFTGLAPGSYTATANLTGYVDTSGQQATSVTGLGVTAGALARGSLVYDTGRTLDLSLAGLSGYVAPAAGLPVMFRTTYLSDRTYPACSAVGSPQACVVASPWRGQSLFPTAYDVWTGTCTDAKPAKTTVDLTNATTGGAAVLTTGAASVDVQVAGVSQADRTVYAVHAADAAGTTPACLSGEAYTLPATAVGGTKVLLPYGRWTFSLTPTPGTGAVVATLSASGPATVVLVAAS